MHSAEKVSVSANRAKTTNRDRTMIERMMDAREDRFIVARCLLRMCALAALSEGLDLESQDDLSFVIGLADDILAFEEKQVYA
jgi:hypothetical protein